MSAIIPQDGGQYIQVDNVARRVCNFHTAVDVNALSDCCDGDLEPFDFIGLEEALQEIETFYTLKRGQLRSKPVRKWFMKAV